ncbi:hypothetical protein [Prochlorococcus sp. MIT 1307]|uniref:hypothetical protein n=1 Tax=Prochlorococcus sp. MIT 1307 TaxID=3096219 RepID=UPI002A7507F8|nr:hypothetical protein [Prochlorococcus sp. MIT 1307]
MIEFGFKGGITLLALTPFSFSGISLYFVPALLYAVIYFLSQWERKVETYSAQRTSKLTNHNQLQVKINELDVVLSTSRRQNNPPVDLLLKEEQQKDFSIDLDLGSSKIKFLQESSLSLIKLCKMKIFNESRDLLRKSSLKNFSFGALTIFVIGGVSIASLEDNIDVNSRSNGASNEEFKKVNSLSLSENFEIREKNIPVTSAILDLTKTGSISITQLPSSLETLQVQSPINKNDDLLRRRLLFELTPKEYASLIPTMLEFEWYGLGPL